MDDQTGEGRCPVGPVPQLEAGMRPHYCPGPLASWVTQLRGCGRAWPGPGCNGPQLWPPGRSAKAPGHRAQPSPKAPQWLPKPSSLTQSSLPSSRLPNRPVTMVIAAYGQAASHRPHPHPSHWPGGLRQADTSLRPPWQLAPPLPSSHVGLAAPAEFLSHQPEEGLARRGSRPSKVTPAGGSQSLGDVPSSPSTGHPQ